jgi:hypothetical protein
MFQVPLNKKKYLKIFNIKKKNIKKYLLHHNTFPLKIYLR